LAGFCVFYRIIFGLCLINGVGSPPWGLECKFHNIKFIRRKLWQGRITIRQEAFIREWMKVMENNRNSVLEELYKEHSQNLKGYVYRFLRSENEAEELVQEAFLRFHNAKNPGEIHSPKAFLYRIAHNLAMKTLRRRRIVRFENNLDNEMMEVESTEPPADQALNSKQEYQLFCKAVAQLPPKCRKVFTLRVINKHSYKEIAEKMDISVSTAEKHVLKGMRDCQHYMKQRLKPSATVQVEKRDSRKMNGDNSDKIRMIR
jgi:RNA polymerase sigma factor (sigma-70 family)